MEVITPQQAALAFSREARFQLPKRPSRALGLSIKRDGQSLLLNGPGVSARVSGQDCVLISELLQQIDGRRSSEELINGHGPRRDKTQIALQFLLANGFICETSLPEQVLLATAASMIGRTDYHHALRPTSWTPCEVVTSSSSQAVTEIARTISSLYPGRMIACSLERGMPHSSNGFSVVISEDIHFTVPKLAFDWILPVRLSNNRTTIGPLIHHSRLCALKSIQPLAADDNIPLQTVSAMVIREMMALSTRCFPSHSPTGFTAITHSTLVTQFHAQAHSAPGMCINNIQQSPAYQFELMARSDSHNWLEPRKRFFQYREIKNQDHVNSTDSVPPLISDQLRQMIEGTFGSRLDGRGYIPSAGNLRSIFPIVQFLDSAGNCHAAVGFKHATGYFTIPTRSDKSPSSSNQIEKIVVGFYIDLNRLSGKYGSNGLRLGLLDVGVAFYSFDQIARTIGAKIKTTSSVPIPGPSNTYCPLAIELIYLQKALV